MTDHNPTPNADAAPVVEGELQERLREFADGQCIQSDDDLIREAADRLDHLEARERAGRELGEALRRHDPEDEAVSYVSICAGVYQRTLDHLDGGSTND